MLWHTVSPVKASHTYMPNNNRIMWIH